MSHTPGPWTTSAYGQYLGGKRGKLSIVATSPPKIVAENVNPEDGPLIEAAPELLEACKALLYLPTVSSAGGDIEACRQEAKQQAEAAIAKAEETLAS